jgi:hypothetical protein
VPDDATLEDFLGGDPPADEAPEDTADDERDDQPGEGPEPDDTADHPGPATVTFEYDPEGGACAVCGEAVTERWADEPGLVCGDCKEW